MMLKVVHLCAGYGGISILNGISFHIEQGEVVTLIGGNGAGKSTILKAIIGQIPVREGKIFFKERRVDGFSPEKMAHLGLTLVPENRGLFGGMSVEENLKLGAFRLRLNAAALKKAIEDVWQMFPVLKDRLHQKVHTMSGGEQQMLAIAKGLMSDPRLMLLDEPSVGLAPRLVQDIFSRIQILKQKRVTLLLVEQNIRHALDCADRGYVLERGRIVLEGSSRELMANHEIKKAYLGVQDS
jgi:branched-chain amino acid transport system ATP-binding protein